MREIKSVTERFLLVSLEIQRRKWLVYINSNDFEINELGEVIEGGEVVDRLQLVSFKDNENLERMGQNYYLYDYLRILNLPKHK